LRARWASWNPQRAAAKDLERRVLAGELTLADTIAARARSKPEPLPGDLPKEAAHVRGWYPHGARFKWPAPRNPEVCI
jgi:glutathione S-transferase